jgi:hypothetical protein
VGIAPDEAYASIAPSNQPDEWNRDHREYILRYWLPTVFYNSLGNTRRELKIWRFAVEAYLSGAELRSDGSTAVSDIALSGCKDPMGVAHDYVFELHHLGWSDAYGHIWGLFEANWMYSVFFIACGHPDEGRWRFAGLCLVSWVPWWVGADGGLTRIAWRQSA